MVLGPHALFDVGVVFQVVVLLLTIDQLTVIVERCAVLMLLLCFRWIDSLVVILLPIVERCVAPMLLS